MAQRNDTRRGILIAACVVLTLSGAVFAAGSTQGWTLEDGLRQEIPRCPQAGTYSWSTDLDSDDSELLSFATRLLVERNWTHVEQLHLGRIRYEHDDERFQVALTTLRARCIPGLYNPSSGRMEAPR